MPPCFDPRSTGTQHHRADIRLAEGEPQDWHALRQAGKRFCCDGLAGLRAAMSTLVLFVQNLIRTASRIRIQIFNDPDSTARVLVSHPGRNDAAMGGRGAEIFDLYQFGNVQIHGVSIGFDFGGFGVIGFGHGGSGAREYSHGKDQLHGFHVHVHIE